MNEKTDEELVSEVQDGSISSFEVLVRRYEGRLIRFAQRITGNEGLSQESVQDAFFSIYKTIDRVDTSKKFSVYLYSVVRNKAISALRATKPAVSLHEMQEISDKRIPLDHFISREQMGEIQSAVNKLPQEYRSVIHLRYYEELSYGKISKRLHAPLNTVRTRLRRAKHLLRQYIEP